MKHFFLHRNLHVKALAAFTLCATMLSAYTENVTVNQTDQTLFSSFNTTLYVDVTNGAETNTGTSAAAPLRSLSNALEIAMSENAAGRSVRVTMKPGIYREVGHRVYQQSDNTKALSVEAETAGTVIITGGEVLTGWKAAGFYYYTDWTNNFSRAPDYRMVDGWMPTADQAVIRRREMLTVGNEVYRQVTADTELDTADPTLLVEPGTFCVNEVTDTIFVRPRDFANFTNEEVVAGVNAYKDVWTDTIPNDRTNYLGYYFNRWNGIRFYGLTFTHYVGVLQSPALNVNLSSNVLVDSCTFFANTATGLSVGGTDSHNTGRVTITNVTAISNGWKGIGGSYMYDTIVANCRAFGNSWKSYDANDFGSGDAAGIKIWIMRNSRVFNNMIVSNYSEGYWADWIYKRVIFENNTCNYNKRNGIFYEVGLDTVIRSNTFIGNGGKLNTSAVACGIYYATSSNALISNNIIASNEDGQIGLIVSTNRIVSSDTDPVDPYPVPIQKGGNSLTLVGNTLIAYGDQKIVELHHDFDGYGRTNFGSDFMATFTDIDNRYYHASDENAFVAPHATNNYYYAYHTNYEGWVALYGHTTSSRYVNVLPPAQVTGIAGTQNALQTAVTLSWNVSTNVTYTVYRTTNESETPTSAHIVQTNITAGTFTDTSFPASSMLYYYIAAVNAVGDVGTLSAAIAVTNAGNTEGPAIIGAETHAVFLGENNEVTFFVDTGTTGMKRVSLIVFDLDGAVVARIAQDVSGSTFTWNAKNDRLRPIRAGVYTYRVDVIDDGVETTKSGVLVIAR